MVEEVTQVAEETGSKRSAQLTKRNQEYVFQLQKALDAAAFSAEEKETITAEVTPQLLAAQAKGQTARQLFGTVAEYMATLKKPEVIVAKNDRPLLMWLDNGLLLLGMLSGMTAFTGFMAKAKRSTGQGVLTLFFMAFLGSVVFLLLYQFFYKYQQRPDMDVSKRPKWWVSLPTIFGAILVWMVLTTLTQLLPAVINPELPNELLILLAVVSFGGWWFFHKRFNMVTSFMPVKR